MDSKKIIDEVINYKDYVDRFYNKTRTYKKIREQKDIELQEELLTKVFQKNTITKENKNLDIILMKVTMLNSFYSTMIKNKDLVAVARYIKYLKIDEKLVKYKYKGKPNIKLIHELAYGIRDYVIKKDINNIYSFASKYCAWHEPNLYPIVDSYTKGVLYKINKELNLWKTIPHNNSDGFKRITHDALNHYDVYYDLYMGVLSYVKEEYKLTLSLKQLDIFMYEYGKEHKIQSQESGYYETKLKRLTE